jgi:hypothetical protein
MVMRMAAVATVAVVMAASGGAWAEEPARERTPGGAAAGAGWDDSHMQSRHGETPRTNRPRISGVTGYGALVSGAAEPSKPTVEELEFTSQREWAQGALSVGSNERARAAESASQPSGSTRIQRGSTLRSGSVTSGSR